MPAGAENFQRRSVARYQRKGVAAGVAYGLILEVILGHCGGVLGSNYGNSHMDPLFYVNVVSVTKIFCFRGTHNPVGGVS